MANNVKVQFVEATDGKGFGERLRAGYAEGYKVVYYQATLIASGYIRYSAILEKQGD